MNYSSYAKKLADVFSDPNRAEAFRREIYYALVTRLESHKKLRKRLTDDGKIPVEVETEVDRLIKMYGGPDGILVNFMGDEELDAAAAKTGKDEGQIDLVDEIAKAKTDSDCDANLPSLGDIDQVVDLVLKNGPLDVRGNGGFGDETITDNIRKALNGFTKDECLTIIGFYLSIDHIENDDDKLSVTPPAPVSRLLCDVSDFYLHMRAPIDAKARGDLVGVPAELLADLAAAGDKRAIELVGHRFPVTDLTDEIGDEADWEKQTLREPGSGPVEPIVNRSRGGLPVGKVERDGLFGTAEG